MNNPNRNKSKSKYRQQRNQNERAANRDTLALMLQAERREIPIVSVLLDQDALTNIVSEMDPFDEAETVVDFVCMEMDFDECTVGEIDPVGQEHFLDGPNYDSELDDDIWENES